MRSSRSRSPTWRRRSASSTSGPRAGGQVTATYHGLGGRHPRPPAFGGPLLTPPRPPCRPAWDREPAALTPPRPFAVCRSLRDSPSFVDELRAHERFHAFVRALPTKARVSESVLPLVLAALHDELGQALLVVSPEDADARDAAEAASWFLGQDRVALLPGRGVSLASGLAAPPHLVGERYRALDVLAAGGLVCASATSLAEGLPPLAARPSPLELRVGDEPGVDGLAEALALAGYERVERVDDRGQFAVRGGIVDVFPSTGREPLRVELFGDEIEQVRAFSPFTQRALHPADNAVVYPAAERRADVVEIDLGDDEEEDPELPTTSCRRSTAPRTSCGRPTTYGACGRRRASRRCRSRERPSSTSSPAQPHAFEAQRPAISARGLAEAENELAALVRAGNRVVVASHIAGKPNDRPLCSAR